MKFIIKGEDLLKNKEFFTEIITKPIRYTVLIALILSISGLLFAPVILPSNMSYVVGLINFLNKYSGILFTVLFISFFLFVAQLVSDGYQFAKKKKNIKNIKKIQTELYDDERVWAILLKLYYANGDSVYLVRSNQQVLLLEQYFMISRTSTTTFFSGYDLSEIEYPYILQPETERRIREILNK